jgi:hypothetical protein
MDRIDVAFKGARIDILEFRCNNKDCYQFNDRRESRCNWTTLEEFKDGVINCDYYYPGDKIQKLWNILYEK